MNIALVDDIPSELDRLEAILDDYAASNGLNIDVSRFSSAEELLDAYRPYQYTIVFLDIYMQGASGVEAARLIREMDSDTIIVFQTTSTEHMADAFQTHAYEYVIKPVQPERIFALMDDVLRRSAAARGKRFSFTCGRQNYELAYSEIESVQGSGNYLNVTDSRGNAYRTRMTFSAASKTLLEDARFLQLMPLHVQQHPQPCPPPWGGQPWVTCSDWEACSRWTAHSCWKSYRTWQCSRR